MQGLNGTTVKPENKGNSNFDCNWNFPIGAWNMIFKTLSILVTCAVCNPQASWAAFSVTGVFLAVISFHTLFSSSFPQVFGSRPVTWSLLISSLWSKCHSGLEQSNSGIKDNWLHIQNLRTACGYFYLFTNSMAYVQCRIP